jgi:hypothetical protein
MNRRSLLTGALALALMPRKAYSFAGGWALPAAFIELESGRILELEHIGNFPALPDLPATSNYRCSDAPGMEFATRIVTPECTAWFDRARFVATTWRPGRPIPTVILTSPRTLHEQHRHDSRRA